MTMFWMALQNSSSAQNKPKKTAMVCPYNKNEDFFFPLNKQNVLWLTKTHII
jgi:hypothetical protein